MNVETLGYGGESCSGKLYHVNNNHNIKETERNTK